MRDRPLSMLFLSFWDSPNQLETVTFWFDLGGAVVEFGVAITAAIIAHKEFGKEREKALEKYVAVFAGIAAFLVLTTALLNHRVSVLRNRESEEKDKEVEKARSTASNAQAVAAKAMTAAKDAINTASTFKHRSLSEEQIQSAKSILSKYSGTKAKIMAAGNDADSGMFAKQLESILNSCGWTVPGGRMAAVSGMGLDARNVEIWINRESDVPAATALLLILNNCGIVTKGFREEQWDGSDIDIRIGPK
jgi:hypothetical protein